MITTEQDKYIETDPKEVKKEVRKILIPKLLKEEKQTLKD